MSSSSSSSSDSLPFNEKNVAITEAEVNTLLKTYNSKYKVKDINLFRCAMVHKSYCTRKNENCQEGNISCPGNCIPLQECSNERLEFLGDAVLNLVIGSYLYERYTEENEGFLTKIRTKIVCGSMLAELSQKLKLNRYFIISKQIEEANGRENVKLLEDTLEAFIGALFSDSNNNLDVVSDWILNVVETHVDFAHIILNHDNPKDALIRYFQHTFGYIPKFHEFDIEISDGKKLFKICLKDKQDQIISIGQGYSKKKAENDCAQNYLSKHVIV